MIEDGMSINSIHLQYGVDRDIDISNFFKRYYTKERLLKF